MFGQSIWRRGWRESARRARSLLGVGGTSPRLRLLLLGVGLCIWGGLGCGPAGYLSAVRREATRAVADAGAQGAAERAPYEWTSALIYLDRAREFAGHARWQDALVCGRRATTFARAAMQRVRPSSPPSP